VSARREPWGTTREGEPVELFTLEQGALRARLASFGATLVSLEVPDRRGERADVVLGFDDLAGYESPSNPHLGGLVGRSANRIAGAHFTLDGRAHVLAANEGRNHLHGGARGFDRRVWRGELHASRTAVRFERVSPDGEEGYPGNLRVSAEYALERDRLVLTCAATTDVATLVNLVQHSYFNLAGAGTVLEHALEVRAERVLEVDAELVPTGRLLPVASTPFDFTTPRALGERLAALLETPAGGYDVCYALPAGWATGRRLACVLREPASGRELRLETTAHGLQLYTGNRLSDLRGKGGRVLPRFGGVCLEAQALPDAIHHEGFPSSVLRPGRPYAQTTIWTFQV
jgi:aldose 1-epimerase